MNLHQLKYELFYEFWYLKSFRYRKILLNSVYRKSVVSRKLGGYSIKNMVDRGLLFVHIPKCSGTYINQCLFGSLGGGHLRANDYIRMLGKGRFETLHTFTVMRNPWDRVYSAYRHLQGRAVRAEGQDDVGNLTFEKFVRSLSMPAIYNTHLVMKPQYLFVTDRKTNSHLMIKKIWYQDQVEELLSEYQCLETVDALERNASGEAFDRKELYSRSMRDKVGELYSKDIRLGRFSFE